MVRYPVQSYCTTALVLLLLASFQNALSQAIITNSAFDNTSSWTFYTNGRGSFQVDTAAPSSNRFAHVIIGQAGSNVQLYQTGVALQANKQYRLSFRGYSNTGHDVSVFLHKHTSPYTSYGFGGSVIDLSQSWNTHTIDFVASGFSGTATDGRLRMWFASSGVAGDHFYFDDVTIVPLTGTPPLITEHPTSAIVNEGQAATFHITATGTPAPTYQWHVNETSIPGATSASLTTAPLTMTDSGKSYRCIASNTLGSVTSTAAMLRVNGNPPLITTQPLPQNVHEGDSVSFAVAASGTSPLSYQWLKNGNSIPSATISRFVIASASMSDSGAQIAC
jgi:hypothetical protein